MFTRILTVILLLAWLPIHAGAAVGCDLNDPDRDVKRLFPGSTGYKTLYKSIAEQGGDALLARVETRLGDRFHGLFETADVPYTLYEIFREGKLVGYIHGVNQKGQYGGIQVFLALDPDGAIRSLYYQKLTSRQAERLRSREFGAQFAGLRLRDFQTYDVRTGQGGAASVAAVKNPAPEAENDFRATFRAVKKNLILMDEFIFSRARSEGKQP